MTLSLLGITTVALPTLASDGFLPSLETCAKLITPKTKAIALVTPNNPVRSSRSTHSQYTYRVSHHPDRSHIPPFSHRSIL